MDKFNFQTKNTANENIDLLSKIFPSVVTEAKDKSGNTVKAVNFQLLKQLLSSSEIIEQEAYEFTWPGKKKAILDANKPTRKTLRPVIDKSKNWDTTENLYIEGDNLEVLKLLQESYLNKIDVIYIDPPYNTGQDFIYKDRFEMDKDTYNKKTGLYNEDLNKNFSENNGTNPRFHSDWCSMIYTRLMFARNLLCQEGVIFLSIDDNELDNLKKICHEIFGESNFLAQFTRVTKKGGKSTDTYAKNHDYVLAYSKDAEYVSICGFAHNDPNFKNIDRYYEQRGPYKLNQTLDYNTLQYNSTMDYPLEINKTTYVPGGNIELQKKRHEGVHGKHDWVWRWSKKLFEFGYENGWIEISKTGRIYTKTYLNAAIVKDSNGEYAIEYIQRTKPVTTLDFVDNQYSNDNSNKELCKLMGSAVFDYSKPTALIEKLISSVKTKKDAIILDFFSGSGATAQAVMQLNAQDLGNRKFIMVQLPEECSKSSEAYKLGFRNICQIGQQRIRRAGEEILKQNDSLANSNKSTDTGFRVFKLDSSNMEDVFFSPDKYSQNLLAEIVNNIKPDRNDLDLLFSCILEVGLSLSLNFSSETVENSTVYTYNNGELIACFAEETSEKVIKEIANRKPAKAIFRDSSFKNASTKINAYEIFKLLSPQTYIKVL